MTRTCKRCGLEVDPARLADGRCPSCAFQMLPKLTLILPDDSRLDIPASGRSIGRAQFEGNPDARTVSRRHIRIYYQEDRELWVVMRHSEAPVQVNETSCPNLGVLPLAPGDTILLGRIRVTIADR